MDILSAVIGALIGFVSSIGIIVVERLIDRSGKLKIYAKVVYDRIDDRRTWGFHRNQDGLFLNIPLWIEIQNLSNSTRALRDVNLVLYNEGRYIVSMKQINRSGKKENVFHYANNGSYSFVIEPRTITKYECYFILKKEENNIRYFDQIKLRYFDEYDREHNFVLGNVEGNWVERQFTFSGEWQALNK